MWGTPATFVNVRQRHADRVEINARDEQARIRLRLSEDPTCIAIEPPERFDHSNLSAWDPEFRLYQEKLGPYITKEEFEKHMTTLNTTVRDNFIGVCKAFCCAMWCPCTLGLTAVYIWWTKRQLHAALVKSVEDVNPAMKERQLRFELVENEKYGPYLVVRILAPVKQASAPPL